jgi:hypothetical protein
MNDEHVLALIEAVDGANLHTIHILTFDAVFDNDIGHAAAPEHDLKTGS